ncbi:MAG TPA: phospholipid carrier-dependent glycosyltransferase [Thermoanaerobaculia bacterium]|nr:phospholipid carrier-dependent glycosyltransferase [Thermoanaerobaculia bacterium]
MSDTRSTSARPRRWWAVVGLGALLLQAALLWIEWRPAPRVLWGDEGMYWQAAEQLRAGVEPDLHLLWPPLYPRFLATLMPLGAGTRFAAQLAQVALLGIAAILLSRLGRALLPGVETAGGIHAGDVAAALLLLDPQVAVFGAYLWPEALHLALFLFAWWALVARAHRWPWLVAAGVALGLALLTKSLLLAFVPVLLFPLLLPLSLLPDGPPWRRLLRPAVVGGAMALTLLPVQLHNRERYGVATVADSSAFNAWVGLNDRSRRNFVDEIVGDELGVYLRSAADPATRAAIARAKVRRLVEARGVSTVLRAQLGRQYFRLFDRDSFLTDQLPGGPIANHGDIEGGDGYGYVAPPAWLAAALRGWGWTIYGTVLVAAALAAATLRAAPAAAADAAAVTPAQRRAWLLVAALFVVYNLALLLVLHVKTRYRVQMMPVLDLWAAATLVWAWSRLRRPAGGETVHRPSPPARAIGASGKCWVAGGVLAALLLFLAFGGR